MSTAILPEHANALSVFDHVQRTSLVFGNGSAARTGELAKELGSAPQAVGQACGANPIPIIIPCHRVVASGGKLGGFSGGDGAPTKRKLLNHEAVNAP